MKWFEIIDSCMLYLTKLFISSKYLINKLNSRYESVNQTK